jgi:cellobiose phosphorylase
MRMHDDMLNHINKQAFKHQVYQSYIGHDGSYLDDEQTVMLTGQAMALLNKTATKEQAKTLSEKTKAILFNKELGGYQLNSLYDASKHPLGRAFYFAYHHKENGAVFSHMAMMYAFGLYTYGLIDKGREAFMAILERSLDEESEVYRGIPEYFNDKGIGKYLYLTGSASWLLYILRRQVFGLAFDKGTLYLEPKLTKDDFIEGKASIHTITFGNETTIEYRNVSNKPFGSYKIVNITADGQTLTLPITKHYQRINVELG